MTALALEDVRVLEFGGDVGSAYATRLLTDLGAVTTKIEPPEGDRLRKEIARCSGDRAKSARGLFEYLNSNKRSVVIDPDDEGEQERLRALYAECDIVIERLGPGGLDRLGLDRSTRGEVNPNAVVVRISNWGLEAPHSKVAATPLTLQAAAGWVGSRGDPSIPYVQVGGRFEEYVIACYASTAALTGRAQARRTGRGGDIDLSVVEAMHSTLPYTRLLMETLEELGWGTPGNQRTPFGIRRCKDGWVGINILTGQQWVDACTLTGLYEYADLQQELMRGEADLGAFARRLDEWLTERTVEQVVDACQAFRIPTVPVGSGDRLTTYEHWRERPFFLESSTEDGTFTRPGFPWRLSATPPRKPEQAPRLGAHT